jgi:hypothetical protein
MKTKTYFYLLLGLIICCISCTHNKPRNNKIKQDEYFSVPILQVNHPHLLPVLDTIIREWYQHANDSDAKKRCFALYDGDRNPADTLSQLNRYKGNFDILEFPSIDSYFHEGIVTYCNCGCFYYKQHLFFVHKCFKETHWFSKTNQSIKLKKAAVQALLNVIGVEYTSLKGWEVDYKGNKFLIPSYGGRWWGNPSDNNR